MCRALIFAFLLALTACKKDPPVWSIQNLSGDRIQVLGHGGMGESYRYPMNSFESLSNCLSLEPDGTEMDVCITKDSVLVLSHSQSLEEQTGCSGMIKDKRWSEIRDCNYTGILGGKEELIPASYFFDRADRSKFLFTFDCKVTLEDSPEYLERFANALIRHIETYDLVANCFIESFNGDFLKLLHAKNNQLKLFLYSPDYATGLRTSQYISVYGLTLDTRNITASEIRQAHEQGLRITLFNTFTEGDNIDAIEKSPDCIQTDRVDFLIHALKE